MMGPLPGLTMRRTDKGIAVVRLHYSADPAMTPARVKELRDKYPTDAKWNQEMEIDYMAKAGTLVYPEFDAAVHVLPDARIPKRGCRFMAIDPHPRTPCAFLWVLVDRWGDWYVYRELWPSVIYGKDQKIKDGDEENRLTIKEYAEAVAWLEGNELEMRHAHTAKEYAVYRRKGGEKIIYRLMDQAGKGFAATGEAELLESYAKRFARYGIQCRDPRKAHQTGEDAIRDLLKPRHHSLYGNYPRLHIAASCVELIKEFGEHRYVLTTSSNQDRDLRQDRSQFRCHMIDDLRYLATSPCNFSAQQES